MKLPDLLDSRRTIRGFSSRLVDDDDLVDVLWAAQGHTSDGRKEALLPFPWVVIRG